MQLSVLQDFLNLRLLDIGAEDSRLVKLGEACQELAQHYAAEPQSVIAPLLAAWDPSAGSDPALIAIGNVLEKHWPTYRGAFPDEPLTLYRSIVLEAVMLAMEQQGTIAVAISLIGKNVLPHLPVGQEASILSKIMERAQAITSIRLEKFWGKPTEAPSIAPLKSPTISTSKGIEPNTWLTQISAAAGPSNRQGQPLPTPNPNWPNSGPAWSYDFSDRMAALLGDVHDKAVSASSKVIAQTLKTLGDTLVAKLNDFLDAEKARSNQLNRSSHLIWWRQALYSETATLPYRKLAAPLVAIHMAFDLANILPEVYPPAVESLLFEAVRAATGVHSEENISMADLLDIQRQSVRISTIEWLNEQQVTAGGQSLFLQALANSCAAGKAELPRLGINSETHMQPGDWAIWLLREIKALNAASSPDLIEQPKVPA